jgi:hypothetical protein
MIKDNGVWKCECGAIAINNPSIGYKCSVGHGVNGKKGE